MLAARLVRAALARAASPGAALLSTETKASNKLAASAAEAIKDVKAGDTVLIGGFGLCGIPENLIEAVTQEPALKDLTCVSNNAGVDGFGIGKMLATGQVRRFSFIARAHAPRSFFPHRPSRRSSAW